MVENAGVTTPLHAAAEEFRAAIDAAAETDRATFARRARNALARAVLASAFGHETGVDAPTEPAPFDEVRAHVGDELASDLVELYEELAVRAGWTTQAIDVLEPLHALSRR
jgi:hypothetical protein